MSSNNDKVPTLLTMRFSVWQWADELVMQACYWALKAYALHAQVQLLFRFPVAYLSFTVITFQ